MARDRKVYGFRKARAEALLALPLSGDQEFPEVRPRGRSVGGSGARLVMFAVTGPASAGSYPATFTDMNTESLGSGTLLDPASITDGVMGNGWIGVAFLQDGDFYFVNAKCDQATIE